MEEQQTRAKPFPPIVFVREEMDARGWDDDALIASSGATDPVEILALEIFLALDPREVGYEVLMSDSVASNIARAFGTSKTLWIRLEEQYNNSRNNT